MRTLSTDELIALGERFGIEVGDEEADRIRGTVDAMLEGLDVVDELPVVLPGGSGERTWHEPTPEEDPYNALVTVCHVPPTGGGRKSDTASGSRVLDGVTVGLKDIVAVAGVPMGCGAETMHGFVPRTDATVVERLRAAGATITAKTNLDEFAGSGSGTTGVDGPVANPHDPERTAGGSSGGSAAAVAAGLVDVALGTDTGGSVRIPGSFCGVVGLKPTYGLVPLTGVVENTVTQDHVGPMAPTVEEAARVLETIVGKDERDPASLQAAGRDEYRVGDYLDAVENPPEIEDVRLGVLEEGFGEGVGDQMKAHTQSAIDQLADTGVEVEPRSVPEFEYVAPIKNLLSVTKLAAHWRDGGAPIRRGGTVDDGYQAAFARRTAAASGTTSEFYRAKLLAGAQVIDAHDGRHYTRAQVAREVVREAFEAALEGVDVLVCPTMPDVAPRIEDADDPGFNYARNTQAANVTRLPAMTVPNGTVEGLPVGFQLMAGAFDEAGMLGVAAAIEGHLG